MAGRSPGEGDPGRPSPDQRRWIHPSELPADARSERRPRSRFAAPITAGLAGALAAFGLATLVWPSATTSPRVASSGPRLTAAPNVLPGSVGDTRPSPVTRLAAWTGARVRYGSAVVFHSDGLLVTSAELVSAASAVEVVAPDGDVVPAQVLGTDAESDLALLRVETDAFRPVPGRGLGGPLQVGMPCLVVGAAPVGGHGTAVMVGTVAAADMVWRHDRGWLVDAIEVDVALPRSSVGGALLDARGELAGIIISARGPVASGPVVVPAERVWRSMHDILEHGAARHAWLGVATADAPPPAVGALVEGVSAWGPSARAGVRRGDLVVALEGAGVEGMASLVRHVRDHSPGEHVKLTLERDGETVELVVRLGIRP